MAFAALRRLQSDGRSVSMFRDRLIVGLMLGLTWLPQSSEAEPSLTVLAEVKPWPVVSRLIGYGGRLWFANSVKGRNHNSADIHSYDLEKGDIRFERHFFSQDAGRPVVFDGLLRWPFEDARFSLGYGHVMTTDGRQWNEDFIPTGRIFHTHALAATDRLIAATSAWRAYIDLSTDGGRTWYQAYDHPTPNRQVSRIVDLVTLEERIFGSLTSRDERGLLQLNGSVVEPVPGWPSNRDVKALTTYQDHVYGLVRMSDRTAIWRTDGKHSEQVINLDDIESDQANGSARDLIADERGLWLVTTNEAGGRIWQSDDGRDWTRRYDFSGGTAFELASYQGRIYLGGTDRKRGIGMLWGSPSHQTPGPDHGPAEMRTRLDARSINGTNMDWTAAGIEFDRLLAEPATYQDRAQGLRDVVVDLLSNKPPPGFFASRLTSPMPDEPMSLIGGAVRISSALMGRALLLFGIALQGEEAMSETAHIPLSLLRAPWTRPPNRAEKYFDTLPFALWAVGSARQDDAATIDTLINRLARQDDPLWLKGDIIGALTAVTDQRYAYDLEAWHSWWTNAQSTWTPR